MANTASLGLCYTGAKQGLKSLEGTLCAGLEGTLNGLRWQEQERPSGREGWGLVQDFGKEERGPEGFMVEAGLELAQSLPSRKKNAFSENRDKAYLSVDMT